MSDIEKRLYSMKVGNCIENESGGQVERVPGGWIYWYVSGAGSATGVFVQKNT